MEGPVWRSLAFLARDGKEIIHPEPKRSFAVPLQGPLPEELNYIP